MFNKGGYQVKYDFWRRFYPLCIWGWLWMSMVTVGGCSTLETYNLDQDPKLASMKAPKAMPLNVALMPLTVSYDSKNDLEKKPTEFRVVLDKEKFLSQQVEVLKNYPIFSSWEMLKEVKGRKLDQYLSQAWEKKKDLLVQVNIKKYQLNYLGVSTGRYVFNLFLWFYAWVPNWWIADEIYRAELEATVQVHSVHSGEKLWEEDIKISRQDRLNDWDRGWKLFGIFIVPSYLSESNWETVRESMALWVERKLQGQLLQKLQVSFRNYVESPKSDYQQKTRKTMAMVVGVSKYNKDLLEEYNEYSYNDAVALRNFLAKRIRKTEFLGEANGTQAKINQKVEQFLAQRSRNNDTFVFYYSGYGVCARDKKGKIDLRLLTFESTLDKIHETSISLAKLLEKLNSIPAQHRLIIIDAAFGYQARGKSMTRQWNQNARTMGLKKVSDQEITEAYKKLQKHCPQSIVLLPCHSFEGSLQLREVQRGLFNYYLLRGINRSQGAVGQNSVLLADLHRYLERKVWSQARKRGRWSQKVQTFAATKKVKLIFKGPSCSQVKS